MWQELVKVCSVAVLVCVATQATAQQASWESLIARMDLVSDEALGGDEGGPAPLAVDCEVSPSDVASFDALLDLSNGAKADALARHAPWGIEVARPGTEILVQADYVLLYDDARRLPTLTSYVLKSADIVSRQRENCFREDGRLIPDVRSTLADYNEPVFDRGHLVPRADLNRSRAAMVNTFVLSNMMPQHDNFNQGIWETLETAVRAWTVDLGTVTVVSGAVFDENGDGQTDELSKTSWMAPHKRVAVPTGFFKILLHERPSGFVDALAILLPHTDAEVPKSLSKVDKLAYLEAHIESIDTIEALTGQDLFADLPDAKEAAVEKAVAAGLWE